MYISSILRKLPNSAIKGIETTIEFLKYYIELNCIPGHFLNTADTFTFTDLYCSVLS